MTTAEFDPTLVDRMLAGEASDIDRARFDVWSDLEPRATEFANFVRAASHRTEEVIVLDLGRAWLQIVAQIDAVSITAIDSSTLTPSAKSRLRSRHSFYSGAALLGAAAAVTIVVGTLVSRSRISFFDMPARTYSTTPGQITTMRLEDDFLVTLAPGSTVRVSGSSATVDGEAYFQILSSADRPFVIHTVNAVVQVLGTKFLVRHYEGEPNSRVVVTEGKVGVRSVGRRGNHSAQTVLTPRMLALVTDTSVVTGATASLDQYIGWTTGRLMFNGEPLGEVAKALERAYGVEILVNDKALASRPIVMAATVGKDSITDILDLVSMTVNAHYTRIDRSFVISPGRVGEPHGRSVP